MQTSWIQATPRQSPTGLRPLSPAASPGPSPAPAGPLPIVSSPATPLVHRPSPAVTPPRATSSSGLPPRVGSALKVCSVVFLFSFLSSIPSELIPEDIDGGIPAPWAFSPQCIPPCLVPRPGHPTTGPHSTDACPAHAVQTHPYCCPCPCCCPCPSPRRGLYGRPGRAAGAGSARAARARGCGAVRAPRRPAWLG
jgi:hypothetical protein